MSKAHFNKTAITPTRLENFPAWYQEVIKSAQMAETSSARGCMIIRPWGYAIWERMQRILDNKIKEKGHENAYFPLFIPLSYLQKEADHVEGFAKECAVVTHHRLKQTTDGQLIPDGELEEPYIVRPTSETIIGESFSNWVQSYRDLPLKINQWANVVRWELRTRLFLRTVEILWQEGHTVHAEEQEADDHASTMLEVYRSFMEDYLRIPTLTGEKTVIERFAGAETTYTLEAMMQDGKALQCGTSHFLGQNFAKAANIEYLDEKGGRKTAWTTSFGMTTRLIGALVMVHGDDNGLVLPPMIAPHQVVILPIFHKDEHKKKVMSHCLSLLENLKQTTWMNEPLRVHMDDRDLKGGDKSWSWIKKGVPVRIEVGMREVESQKVSILTRLGDLRERNNVLSKDAGEAITHALTGIHSTMYQGAESFRDEHVLEIDDFESFKDLFSKDQPGFAKVYWCNDSELEEKLAKDLGVTTRCILKKDGLEHQVCFLTGKKAMCQVIFAKAY